MDRFGRIDVLINNAANFYAGFFEELSEQQVRAQIETNLFGPMNVTRAVLPVMRASAPGTSSLCPPSRARSASTSASPTPPPNSPSRASWKFSTTT
ncbi:SDR family NAD(P)-dependent oxidoreductase [Streptomyces sp. NPDC058107]|uniref:SDR family NAD(P)-dependent oxidoreductase n=1 Tax=Streptomyces sp. NPDC058107 TaxID=3346343 RepID=UPI0036EF10AC